MFAIVKSNKGLLLNHFNFLKNKRCFSYNLVNQSNKIYDVTSDTATIPTDEMFDLMKTAHKGDDVMTASESVNELENHVAKLLGQEAALFCTSGTLTNQLGLRLLLNQPPHSVICDARSHIFNYECGGVAYHSQASISPVMPQNGHHLTVEDIHSNLITDHLCSAPTRVIALENTLDGSIMPLYEIERIHHYAKEKSLALHLDGARLWNASQETGIALQDYGRLFDTVSICLSKGVGAPIGSIVASSRANIQKARHLRKLMGGGWRQAGFLALAARDSIERVVPTMKTTHALTRRLASGLQQLGMHLSYPCETNMVFLDTAAVGISVHEYAEALKPHRILLSDLPGTLTRIVLHYQIDGSVVDTMLEVAAELVEKRKLDPRPIVVNSATTSSVYPTQ